MTGEHEQTIVFPGRLSEVSHLDALMPSPPWRARDTRARGLGRATSASTLRPESESTRARVASPPSDAARGATGKVE